MGSCTAGGAYVPAMSDESDHRPQPGHDLPRRAAAGEGGDRRGGDAPRSWAAPTSIPASPASPIICAADDAHALGIARRIVANLNRAKPLGARRCDAARAALRSGGDLTASSRPTPRKPYDVREVIARFVDGSELDEFKALYGTTLVCGFARIRGYPVGILANNGILFSRIRARRARISSSSAPARHPADLPAEHHRLHGRPEVRGRRHRQGRRQDGDGGRDCARCRSSPCIIGGSFGAGNYGMCGRAYSARASCGCGRTRASP